MSFTPPPSALNFLAGLFAGAGINMLTSVTTGPVDIPRAAIVGDAAMWVLAAAAATWLAHLVSEMNHEIDRQLQDDFDAEEEAGVHRSVRAAMSGRLRLATAATIVAAALGVLLLPNLLVS
jgi:hypothetical protein